MINDKIIIAGVILFFLIGVASAIHIAYNIYTSHVELKECIEQTNNLKDCYKCVTQQTATITEECIIERCELGMRIKELTQ